MPADSPHWTVGELLAAALAADVRDAPVHLSLLLDAGLIALVAPGDEADFARRHRLEPLVPGIGPAGGDETQIRLGLPDQPVITVPAQLFAFWAWATLEPQLWAACDVLAREAGTQPEPLLRGMLASLQPLLASGAAYLDAVGRS